jgi:hypothetical protein
LSAHRFAAREFSIATCMDRYADMLPALVAPKPRRSGARRGRFATQAFSHCLATVRRGRRWLASRARPRPFGGRTS